jgi:hypothetical protein
MLHLEYFHDHVRIEQLFLDGAPQARNGYIQPDLAQPGMGLRLKTQQMAPFIIYSSETP